MRHENWFWLSNKIWNMSQFTMIEISDRGPDYSERYAIIGWIGPNEWCMGLFKDEEDAQDELDRLMGHID